MTYASANRRPNAAALVGALGIPGAFGALLVVGLAVTVVTVPPRPRPQATPIAEIPLPPPPPTPDTPRTDAKTQRTVTAPDMPTLPTLPPIDFGTGPVIDALPGAGDPFVAEPVDFGLPPGPSASASPYDPVAAKVKGNPGTWVTTLDYRPRWIMEEMAGTARFSLAIDARGKVTGCTITRSTGHAPLDGATCDLVAKRARFDAARDGSGKAVAGSYSGSVTWQIPE